MREVSEDARCELKVGELRERLIQSGKPAGLLSRRILEGALRRLARHSLVTIERGFAGEDGESILLNPVIEKVLPPGKFFEYTSGCPLPTPFGSMRGTYQMITSEGESFDAEIAPFALAEPYAVH